MSHSHMSHELAKKILRNNVKDIALSMSQITKELDRIGRFDIQTGKVDIDKEQLKMLLSDYFGAEFAKGYYDDLLSLANDGYVRLEEKAVFPWKTFTGLKENL